jgi:hypothetical protein
LRICAEVEEGVRVSKRRRTHSIADDIRVSDLSIRSSPRDNLPEDETKRVDVGMESVGTAHEYLRSSEEVRGEQRGSH